MRPDEIFGSSHSGRMQKRYKHLKDWTLYREEKQIGQVQTNEKSSEEETLQIREWLEKLNGTKAVLRWTAVDHFDCEKVVVTL